MSFPIIKPNNISTASRRRLIFGKGINDADYMVYPILDGKRICCPYYRTWKNMLSRVFNKNYHARFPTYKNCSIDESWLKFSSFKSWMEKQEWKSNHLDKDLLIVGNKIYGPQTCVFISPELNSLINDKTTKSSSYPQGISIQKTGNKKKFVAEASIDGNKIRLGGFETAEKAENVYKAAKAVIIARAAAKQSDPRIRIALMKRAHDFNMGASS